MRKEPMSGAEDEDYFAKALLNYEAEYEVPFTLCGYLEVIAELRNNIALLRLAIRSLVGRNNGTTNPESGCVGSAVFYCGTTGGS
ncbi:hypothetical protein Tco_0674416 [Tanacetum coccineum]